MDVNAPKAGGAARAGVEHVVLALAAKQHGVVERSQLHDAGVSPRAVERRVSTGLLRRIHRGVYAVEVLVDATTSAAAAVLACGTGAVISHRSGAALLDLLAPLHPSDPMDVSVRTGERRRPGIRLHRPRQLDAQDVTVVDGVPVTIAARTLADIAGIVSLPELERAVARAFGNGLASPEAVRSQLARWPRRGGRRLAALIDSMAPGRTRSEAEDQLLALLRRAQLPAPRVNATVSGYEVDLSWPGSRFIVEVDGFAFHASRSRFEGDRRRDAVLAAEGFRVMRVTWRQMNDEPEAVLVRIAQALARQPGVS